MFLVRLVYASRLDKDTPVSEIRQILDKSRKNNEKDGITGVLCFNSKYFLQCLEGPRDAVNRAYNRIGRDPRHTDLALLSFDDIVARDFDDWSMGYIGEGLLNRDSVLRYSPQGDFDPYVLGGASAWQLLLALSERTRKLQHA